MQSTHSHSIASKAAAETRSRKATRNVPPMRIRAVSVHSAVKRRQPAAARGNRASNANEIQRVSSDILRAVDSYKAKNNVSGNMSRGGQRRVVVVGGKRVPHRGAGNQKSSSVTQPRRQSVRRGGAGNSKSTSPVTQSRRQSVRRRGVGNRKLSSPVKQPRRQRGGCSANHRLKARARKRRNCQDGFHVLLFASA